MHEEHRPIEDTRQSFIAVRSEDLRDNRYDIP